MYDSIEVGEAKLKAYRADPRRVEKFASDVLVALNTRREVAESVAAALTETSLRGVDSHGIRLILHYAKVIRTGRINPDPQVSFRETGPGTAIVDGDHGFGHYASFVAMDCAVKLARDNGASAVAVVNSSHFGSAGCYALRAAEKGMLAIAVCNSDSFVLPHDGIKPFHGTNPLAFAAPVYGDRPFLVDLATSVVPWNRVQDLISEDLPLPPDVAVNENGEVTLNPNESAGLLPLGGARYGYKGAALASMVEVLSAVLTGMPHCSRLLGMAGPDFKTHRCLGHFFLVIDPDRFVSREVYRRGMLAYLSDLRSQVGRSDTAKPMAPGDREWSTEKERQSLGIPVAHQLKADLDSLAAELGVENI